MSEGVNIKKTSDTIMVLAFAAIIFWFLTALKILIFIAAILLFLGIFFKGVAQKVSNYWLKLAEIVGGFNSKIILSVIFYAILLPVSLIYRCFHKDPLNINRTPSKMSYWHKRDYTFTSSDIENPW